MPNFSSDPLASSDAHDFGLWQLRVDRWRRVSHLLDRAELAVGRLRSECVQAAASELQLLRDTEVLWTYPGPQRFSRLRLEVAQLQVVTASSNARAIVRTLELYGDAGTVVEGDDLRAVGRYFTALVVTADAREAVGRLGRELRALRQPTDARIYELLPVASVEEAIVAVRCNAWVEVCLVGLGEQSAALHAAPPTGLVSGEDRRLLAAATSGEQPPARWLVHWLRAARPELLVVPLDLPAAELHRTLVER